MLDYNRIDKTGWFIQQISSGLVLAARDNGDSDTSVELVECMCPSSLQVDTSARPIKDR